MAHSFENSSNLHSSNYSVINFNDCSAPEIIFLLFLWEMHIVSRGMNGLAPFFFHV